MQQMIEPLSVKVLFQKDKLIFWLIYSDIVKKKTQIYIFRSVLISLIATMWSVSHIVSMFLTVKVKTTLLKIKKVKGKWEVYTDAILHSWEKQNSPC